MRSPLPVTQSNPPSRPGLHLLQKSDLRSPSHTKKKRSALRRTAAPQLHHEPSPALLHLFHFGLYAATILRLHIRRNHIVMTELHDKTPMPARHAAKLVVVRHHLRQASPPRRIADMPPGSVSTPLTPPTATFKSPVISPDILLRHGNLHVDDRLQQRCRPRLLNRIFAAHIYPPSGTRCPSNPPGGACRPSRSP